MMSDDKSISKLNQFFTDWHKRNRGIMAESRPGMFVRIHTSDARLYHGPVLEVVKVHDKMLSVRSASGTRRVHVGHVLELLTEDEGKAAVKVNWERLQSEIRHYAARVEACTDPEEKKEARKWLRWTKRNLDRWRKWEIYDHLETDAAA
jgi:hypothetical protein